MILCFAHRLGNTNMGIAPQGHLFRYVFISESESLLRAEAGAIDGAIAVMRTARMPPAAQEALTLFVGPKGR